MRKILLLSLIVCAIFFSMCRAKKVAVSNVQGGNVSLVEDTIAANSINGRYRFIASFISEASGPDLEALKKLREFVATYSNRINKQIVAENYPWGREGEVDFCYTLNGLTIKEQVYFVKQVRQLLKEHRTVLFSENESCRNKR